MQKLKDDIKQKIIEIGKKRFKKEGFDNTSMKDIATDVGISTGNIYRYFLTKKHLLNEILMEIEEELKSFFDNIPSDYEKLDISTSFDNLISLTLKIAKEKGDTLSILLNSEKESQFIDFRENIVQMFNKKMVAVIKSVNSNNTIDKVVLMSISRAEFEGFTYIVKNNINNIDKLHNNLEIYKMVMINDLGNEMMEVIRNDGETC